MHNRKIVILDAALLCGSGLALAGLWLVYPPLAMIAAGAATIYVVRMATKDGNHARKPPIRR